MKKGDKVKCVDRDDNYYLTDGKVYEVVAGVGCVDQYGDVIAEDEQEFEVVNDMGRVIYCLYPKCGHATWELVE